MIKKDMKRDIYLSFYIFDNHIDLSTLNKSRVHIDLFEKGKLRSNGKTIIRNNCADLHYNEDDLPDDCNERIQCLIDALGGEKEVKSLISKYNAKHNSIILGIPVKTSEYSEDFQISNQMMRKLCDLNLDIQFYF